MKPFLLWLGDAIPRPPGRFLVVVCIRSVEPGHGFAGDGFLLF